ncbi:hypothetical protein JTB14_019939 [Gonioctena quinquepunctata]|nr:hypothetical protein JTB14_019939 [Gonioctena quinquepunctata]
MGKFLSVYFAFVAASTNVHIFRDTQDAAPGPLMSTYIFLFSFVMLLWDLTLYPESLRKLGFLSQLLIEFFIAAFLTESIMIDFWFPLEKVTMGVFPKTADSIDDMLSTGEWKCENLCGTLRSQGLGYVVSYCISLFFLLAVLHATRVIDLRELSEGPGRFFGDIYFRLKKFLKKLIQLVVCSISRKSNTACDEDIDDSDDSATNVLIPKERNTRKTTRRERRGRADRRKSPSKERKNESEDDCSDTNVPFYSKFPEGPGPFFGDIYFRLKKFLKKLIQLVVCSISRKSNTACDEDIDDSDDSATNVLIPKKRNTRKTTRRERRGRADRRKSPSKERKNESEDDCSDTNVPFYSKFPCTIL